MTSDPSQAACAHQAVRDRLVAYWRDVDRHGARDALSYYTPDCVYEMLDHRMQGLADIKHYYAARNGRGPRLVRHVISNLYTEVRAADEVWLEATLCVYAADGEPVLPSTPPIMVADDECLFERGADGQWRMRLHRIRALFTGGAPVFVPPR